MSLLKKVERGKVAKPLLMLLYGVEGIGKSTFGSNAPEPIFLGAEQGTDVLDVNRFPAVKTWEEVVDYMNALINEEHQYKTLVIDTLDSLEPLLWEHIKKESGVKSIELACGGYGKGYIKSAEIFMDFRHKLEMCRSKGMNIIILAHSQVAKFNDPITNIEYDTYKLKLHKRVIPIFVEWVDCLLFTNFEVYTKKNDDGKNRAYGNGSRVIYTEKRPSFEAKNRFSLPFQISLDYQDFAKEIASFYTENKIDNNSKQLRDLIFSKLDQIKDAELVTKIMKYLQEVGDDEAALQGTLERINTIIGG